MFETETTMFSGTGSPARRARLALILACVPATPLLPARALAQTEPELPRVFLDTTYAPPAHGKLISVKAGGDLQADEVTWFMEAAPSPSALHGEPRLSNQDKHKITLADELVDLLDVVDAWRDRIDVSEDLVFTEAVAQPVVQPTGVAAARCDRASSRSRRRSSRRASRWLDANHWTKSAISISSARASPDAHRMPLARY